MIYRLRQLYARLLQKEYPLRLKRKASLIGSMGLFLLAIQNTFLQNFDVIHQTWLAISKVAMGLVASFLVGLFSIGGMGVTASGVFTPEAQNGTSFSGGVCQEVYFCAHACTAGSGSTTCYDFCPTGQAIGSSCTGTNGWSWTCVGFCQSTIATTLTSCTQQPFATGSCALGDPCIGFRDAGATSQTGSQCREACGDLSAGIFTWLSQTDTGLCASGFVVLSGSWWAMSTGRYWQCGSPFGFSRLSGSQDGCRASLGDTGVSTPRGGKKSSIAACGNGRLNPGEQCDDGNLSNGDGCTRQCRMEALHSSWAGSTSTRGRFVAHLRASLDIFERACVYDDEDYQNISFDDIERNPSEQAIRTLQAYCIVKGSTVSHNKKYHAEAATTIGEAIKVLTKIAALDEEVIFDEFALYPGTLPYGDMQPNAWYTTYVLYAHAYGYLDGMGTKKIFGRPDLKALTPISKKQLKHLLENYGVDTASYTMLDAPGRYVSREAFSTITVHAFADDLRDYQYIYGNNIVFYRRLLRKLEKLPASQQQGFLNKTISMLRSRDKDVMGRKYNMDIEGMTQFLEGVLR